MKVFRQFLRCSLYILSPCCKLVRTRTFGCGPPGKPLLAGSPSCLYQLICSPAAATCTCRLLESLHVPTTARKRLLHHSLIALLPSGFWARKSLSSLPELLQLCSSSDGHSLIRCRMSLCFLPASLIPILVSHLHPDLPVKVDSSLTMFWASSHLTLRLVLPGAQKSALSFFLSCRCWHVTRRLW